MQNAYFCAGAHRAGAGEWPGAAAVLPAGAAAGLLCGDRGAAGGRRRSTCRRPIRRAGGKRRQFSAGVNAVVVKDWHSCCFTAQGVRGPGSLLMKGATIQSVHAAANSRLHTCHVPVLYAACTEVLLLEAIPQHIRCMPAVGSRAGLQGAAGSARRAAGTAPATAAVGPIAPTPGTAPHVCDASGYCQRCRTSMLCN